MMYSPLLNKISRYLFYPLWDIYDRSCKLKEWHRLEKNQRDPLEIKRAEQLGDLIRLTAYARAHVPYYRRYDVERVTSFESFRSWPLVNKSDIQQKGDDFLSDQFTKDQLIEAKTGGSTGTALKVYFDLFCQEKRNANSLLSDRWSGWELGDPVGALWGNPPKIPFFKPWVRNTFLDRLLFLDTITMSDLKMEEFLKKIESHKIKFLFGHSHSLYVLASYVHSTGRRAPRLKGIISTSMMLLPQERKLIESVFQCRVTDRYGCEEVGLIACECEKGRGLHLNIDHVHVEFLRKDGTPANPGEEATLVVTDLINYGMPLIRYVVGDVGVYSRRRCPCGRTFPILEKLTGRVADFLVKKDGSLVAGVSLVERTLTAIPGLSQMQIVQEEVDRFTLHVVVEKGKADAVKDTLLDEMASVFGSGIQWDVHFLPALPQERNGKYRFAICKVSNRYQAVAS